ncbi:helix-turn-helix domain-containing protein [Sulfitobacter sabulilitoris]|uniref:Cyclic nucleotide-binding domain-containing protein n=1 Tax=Sulfitobacter sabulilitoris TaxID=2562655 RepID=A0A5S3PBX5_9RHOB|nr:helix-turn-helix domain-containing protein [Sulfitobacter sabulilitoris]TMM51200.1 cyclic nucleotide-binding domain-containing protein [Sulfitobacter sabulilitoris]
MYVTMPNDQSSLSQFSATRRKADRKLARDLKPGGYLFREGDEARYIFRVLSGVLRLTRVMENGRRQVIAFGYPGDVIGFPNGAEHHTDCDVLTPARVVAYRRELLESGAGDAELHDELLTAALREISSMQDHFMMLGRKSASEKLASFLCVLADRVGTPLGPYTQIALPMSRCDIADFLGLTTETISRTITQLRRSGVIALESVHQVIILKPDDLLTLAGGEED